jgi:hypothetical protein
VGVGDGRAWGMDRNTATPGRSGRTGGRAARVKETGTRWGQQSARDEVLTRQIREAILFVCFVLNDSLVQ